VLVLTIFFAMQAKLELEMLTRPDAACGAHSLI